MKFTKMHGLGNDYIYVDAAREAAPEPAALARAISDRHTGVGADGLILMFPSERADVRMEMYNADGSRGRMCGNGLRCVAKYAIEHGWAAGPEVLVETDAGLCRAWCELSRGRVERVRADMGRPALEPRALPAELSCDRVVNHPLELCGQIVAITCVSMGNPHAVVFVEDLAGVDLPRLGPALAGHPLFPDGVNAHFVRVHDRHRVAMVTWERGSGPTRACGTGACAVCVAGVVTARTERRIRASLPGGELDVEWNTDQHVYMSGPAVEVFEGHWPVSDAIRGSGAASSTSAVPGVRTADPVPLKGP